MAHENSTNDIEAMSDTGRVEQWAANHKISVDTVKLLFKDGFTSMEAIGLLDQSDLSSSKIPRGQQKLLLKATAELQGVSASQAALDATAAFREKQVQVTNSAQQQQSTVGNKDNSQNAGREKSAEKSGEQSARPCTDTTQSDSYMFEVLRQFQQVQSGQASTMSNNTDRAGSAVLPSVARGPNQNEAGNMAPPIESWADPQIHLTNAAGKGQVPYYDITDFVYGSGVATEQIVMDTPDGPQLVLRSGQKKPKLETLSLSQWSVANLAILHTLVREKGAGVSEILDYLSHSTRIYQLFSKFQPASVMFYDREYRKAQATQGFRWGTEVPHLQICFLQARTKQNNMAFGGSNRPGNARGQAQDSNTRRGPITTNGQEICKKFNSQKGCHYSDCKYVHVCSVPKCEQNHPSPLHESLKN